MHIIIIYLSILFGIFLEGEMIMISSIIAAHHGYLNHWKVIAVGIVATYCSDCFYFSLGRKRGKVWLNKNQNSAT
jgi:membrane protein DedA with SNARE-associated domain